MNAKNVYRVPVKQWRQWSAGAHSMFNCVYSYVYDNQPMMTHPAAPQINPAHWKTLSWDVAWIAADTHDGIIDQTR